MPSCGAMAEERTAAAQKTKTKTKTKTKSHTKTKTKAILITLFKIACGSSKHSSPPEESTGWTSRGQVSYA